MKFLLILLGVWPGVAMADHVYRCIDASGHVSYQSVVCQSGQRLDRTIAYVPDPVAAPAAATPNGSTRQRISDGRRTSRAVAAGRAWKPQPDACARAKARREQQLQQLGFKRTFDDLSRIDAAVRAVCKGF